MPVCVAGMHRSGTSLLAQLLHRCGLDLGAPADLLPPAPDNPDGFWENRRFLAVNEQLLRRLGGAWDVPPPLGLWRARGARLAALRGPAAGLLRRFEGREPWGWKDPRNALTLPFWRGLVPDLRVIVCVRHPLEVAASLARRDGHGPAFALALWRTYNDQLLAHAPPGRRLVTHFDAYAADPRAELRRVLGWLGLPAPEGTLDRARAACKPGLRHNRATAQGLLAPGVPDDVRDLYARLCAEARHAPPAPGRAGAGGLVTCARGARGAPSGGGRRAGRAGWAGPAPGGGRQAPEAGGPWGPVAPGAEWLQDAGEVLALRRQLRQESARAAALAAELGEAEGQLAAVLASRSWRLTRPLRVLLGWCRRLRG
jgi:hypothetical protein